MKDRKIKILGEEWTIVEKKLDITAGETDYSVKKIAIDLSFNDKPTSTQNADRKWDKKAVLRHEIIHALLFESGIDFRVGIHTEAVVDWFAMQYEKLKLIFDKLKI